MTVSCLVTAVWSVAVTEATPQTVSLRLEPEPQVQVNWRSDLCLTMAVGCWYVLVFHIFVKGEDPDIVMALLSVDKKKRILGFSLTH